MNDLPGQDAPPAVIRAALELYNRRLTKSPSDREVDLVSRLVERMCVVDRRSVRTVVWESIRVRCDHFVTDLKETNGGPRLHLRFCTIWRECHDYIQWMSILYAPALARFEPESDAFGYAKWLVDYNILAQFSRILGAEAIRGIGLDRVGLLKDDIRLFKRTLDIMVGKIVGAPSRDIYEFDFERRFLKDTYQYYSAKALTWIAELEDLKMYSPLYEACMKIESHRASLCLPGSTFEKLIAVVEEALWHGSPVKGASIMTESRQLLLNNKTAGLSTMYKLYVKKPASLNLVAEAFKHHVYKQGTDLIGELEDAAKNLHISEEYAGWIKQAELAAIYEDHITRNIRLYKRSLQYVECCFERAPCFEKAMDEAFQPLLQNGVVGGRCYLELLSMYLLKNLQNRGADTDTVKKLLNLAANNGDALLFPLHYRKKPRLLVRGSINGSLDIRILNSFCSWSNSKMEKMVGRLSRSQTIANDFKEHLERNPHLHPRIKMCVSLLDSRLISSHESNRVDFLPVEMVKGIEVFQRFYSNYSDGRHKKLSWFINGWCRVCCNFDAVSFDICVPTNLAVILGLFNSQEEEVCYSHIQQQTKLDVRNVTSLVNDGILLKKPDSMPISGSDKFMITSNCLDILRRIKISQQAS